MEFNYTVTSEYDGKKLKDIMSRELRMSSNMIKRVKLHGKLEVNGIHTRVIDIAHEGDHVYAFYDDDCANLAHVDGIPIVYEDKYLAVVIKPAGIVTHPTHNHLDDSLLTLLNSEGDNNSNDGKSLHPVMRLDRETSGLLVIAKNGFVHSTMSSADISKKYLAVVYGRYEPESGTIDKYIKRREGSVMVRDCFTEAIEGSHRSITHYNTLLHDPSRDISLVEFILETGRCHQIRVHSLSMNHPLLGDGLYGPNSDDNPSTLFDNSKELDNQAGRQMLHAYSLDFTHPITGERMHFQASLPADMQQFFPEYKF